MTSRKSTSAAPQGERSPARKAFDSLVARITALRASQGAALPRKPHRVRLRPTHPSWWSSFWAARLAVRSGVSLDTFLQHRLSDHLGRVPVPPERLPVRFSIEAGSVITAANDDASARQPWLESFLRTHGAAAVNPGILQGQADAARLAARIEAQRRRVDELTRDVETATRGVAIADPGDDAQAQQMGRPALPAPIGMALQVFALVLLVAESWPLAIPCMEAAGIDSHHLVNEFQRDPVAVVLGSAFAAGATAALFLLAHLTVRRTLRLASGQPTPSHPVWTVIVAVLSVGLTVAMAWSISSGRPDPDLPIQLGHARLTIFLAVLGIPYTSAWFFLAGGRLEQARATARAAARTWDQEHYRILADISRRAAALAEEEQRLSGLETERAAVTSRIRALQQHGAVADRLAADAAGEEQLELATIAQRLKATLEMDRYEFVRQASARGMQPLREEVPAPALTAAARGPREMPERNLGLAG